MKRFGCALAIIGLLAAVASFVLFGTSIFRAFEARPVAKLPIEIGVPVESALLTVETGKLVQVAVAGKVSSRHVQSTGADGGLDLLYRFPFRYTVYDEQGHRIAEGDELLDSAGGSRSVTASLVTNSGGSERVEKSFAKFAVAPPGAVRIVARLEADTDYAAEIEEPVVLLYDRVSKHAARVAIGLLVLLAGGAAAIAGTVIYLIGALRAAGPASG
jgi:hypothetical protein